MKRQERWYQMSGNEILEHLDTNIETGLSPEQLRSGRRQSNKDILLFPELSQKQAILLVLCDVALYFFVFVTVFCASFGRWLEALCALGIIAVNCALSVYLKIVSNKYENAVMAPSVPRCTVRRDGRTLSIDMRDILEGDIVCMKAGDIVPCDIRLLRAKEFSVYEIVAPGDDGKPKYAKSMKAADKMSVDGAVPIGKIYNMAFASSMVLSGYAVGVAVECGKNTFISKNYGGIEMRSENGQSPVDEVINKLLRFTTIALIGMIVPFIFISLFAPSSYATPIDYLSQTAALAISLPLQTITVLFSTVMCCAVRMCADRVGQKETGYAIIKNYGAINRLEKARRLFLFGKTSIAARGLCIESIYSDLKLVQNAYDERSKDCMITLEHAFLINKACYGTNAPLPITENHEGLILRKLSEYGGDIQRLSELSGYISYKRLGNEMCADSAIVSNGDDFAKRSSLVCRTLDRRIIDLAYWYSSDGVDVMLDSLTREKIQNQYERLKSLGYEVISIAKATPKMYDMSSFDDYEGQLVFEGMIAVGPVYASENAYSVRELIMNGLNPVLILPDETDNSVYAVKNLFRELQAMPNIVFASELKRNGEKITDYRAADAYLGFPRAEIVSLIEAERADGVGIASIVVDYSDLAAASRSDYIFACTYDELTDKACTDSYPVKYNDIGASCSAAKKYADCLVSPVTPTGGGIDGVLRVLRGIRSFFRNLEGAMTYILCSLVARILMVYLPLAMGRPAMNASMILFLGGAVDLLAIMAIALRQNTKPKSHSTDVFDSPLAILRANTRSLLISALAALVIFAAGLMIPKADTAMLQAYCFISLLIFQLVLLFCILYTGSNTKAKHSFIYIIIPILAIVLICVALSFIPGLSDVLGFKIGFTAYAGAASVSVVSGSLVFFHFKYRRGE